MDTASGVRIVLAAFTVEIVGVLALVLVVGLTAPGDPADIPAHAERLGTYVGPISGFLLCLAAGYWVAGRSSGPPVLNGFALGVAAAALDLAIVLSIGAPAQLVFILSNVGRVLAGTLGGWLQARSRSTGATPIPAGG